jgi:hypothetical protein
MLKIDVHPTEEELLLCADGELSHRRAAKIRTHLTACWDCRTRMAAIEGTIAGFVRAHHDAKRSALPPIAGPRALLRAQLAELSAAQQTRSEGWFDHVLSHRLAAILVCAVLLGSILSGVTLVRRHARRMPNSTAEAAELGSVPDPNLTPGASRKAQISEVCAMAHEEVVADVSPSLRRQVLTEYGIVNPGPRDYEIDYLIAPGLGGSEDIHNLWPQPYKAQVWNARVKDSLEEHLHQLVCAGDLDLATAQRDIAIDWIAAYKKYFHTDRPLETSEL